MESRLAASFGRVANQEREHPGEEAPGYLSESGKGVSGQRGAGGGSSGRSWAHSSFLGLLAFRAGLRWGP